MRVRAAFVERSTGEILLGPPKSKAGWWMVGIPQAIIPVLRKHLSIFVKDKPGALAFPGVMGGPLRGGNINKMSAWPYAVRSIGAEGLHFHDLRHTGKHVRGVQRRGTAGPHEARGADQAITRAIDSHVQGRAGQRRG